MCAVFFSVGKFHSVNLRVESRWPASKRGIISVLLDAVTPGVSRINLPGAEPTNYLPQVATVETTNFHNDGGATNVTTCISIIQ